MANPMMSQIQLVQFEKNPDRDSPAAAVWVEVDVRSDAVVVDVVPVPAAGVPGVIFGTIAPAFMVYVPPLEAEDTDFPSLSMSTPVKLIDAVPAFVGETEILNKLDAPVAPPPMPKRKLRLEQVGMVTGMIPFAKVMPRQERLFRMMVPSTASTFAVDELTATEILNVSPEVLVALPGVTERKASAAFADRISPVNDRAATNTMADILFM